MLLPRLLLCAATASAARLIVTLPSAPPLLPNPANLPASTHAVLLGPPGVRYNVPLRKDNTFAFSELAAASYLLTVHARDYTFTPLRVDVTPTADGARQEMVHAWVTFRGNEWSHKGPHLGSGKGELNVQLRPAGRKNFYSERAGFSLISFVQSPMILMALVSVVFIFGLPYMMENMDPETKAEYEEMQKNGPLTGSNGAATQLQNFDLAGFLAGRTSGADGGSGGGGKKR